MSELMGGRDGLDRERGGIKEEEEEERASGGVVQWVLGCERGQKDRGSMEKRRAEKWNEKKKQKASEEDGAVWCLRSQAALFIFFPPRSYETLRGCHFRCQKL